MADDQGYALDWTTEEVEDNGFAFLEPGTYNFQVTRVRRERYEGGDKIGPCPKAVVEMLVSSEDGANLQNMEENLLLHSKTQFRIAQFFAALGFEKDPETGKVKINWEQVVGKSGHIKVGVRTYVKKDGNEGKANQIEEWIKPDAADTTTPQQQWSM